MKKNLCLFRTRNHILPIECGRWRNVDISERKCHLCHSGVGDEFHFLFCWPSRASERRKYIEKYYYRIPNVLKFDELMNTKNIRQPKNLCKFVKIILSSCEYLQGRTDRRRDRITHLLLNKLRPTVILRWL